MTEDQFEVFGYTLAEDAYVTHEINHITPEVEDIINEIYEDVLKGKKYLLKRLPKLIKQYPTVPIFKNYLCMVHQVHGDMELAYAINRKAVKEHPHYLYGKINLAAEYLDKEAPEKVPEVLGEAMALDALCPQREVFQIGEFINFYYVVAIYYLNIKEFEQARKCITMMEEADTEHPKTIAIAELFIRAMMAALPERLGRNKDELKQVKGIDRKADRQTTQPPTFNFPEQMQWLYDEDLELSKDKIDAVLALEREPLIKDLCTVLNDTIVRFDYFNEKSGYEPPYINFHATLLLAQLKAEEATPTLLDIIRQDDDYIDFWFGDFMDRAVVPALYSCAGQNLEALLNYVKEPNISPFIKSLVPETVVEIARLNPDRREESIVWSREALKFYAEHSEDETIADTEFLGFFISNLISAQMHELLPEIKTLYDLKLVGHWICGDYASVEKDIQDPDYPGKHHGLDFIELDIYEQYEELNGIFSNTDGDYEEPINWGSPEFEENFKSFNDPQLPIVKEKKIGRNDPCPCGSGKKYKKCCM